MGHGWSFWRLAMGRDTFGACAEQGSRFRCNESRLRKRWIHVCFTEELGVCPEFLCVEITIIRRQGR